MRSPPFTALTYRNNEHRKKGVQDNDRFHTATADRSRTQIDNYHTEVGRNLFHICEFAERMEQGGCTYAPMEPPLPPMCYSILPSTGEVIQIDRWQKGYTATRFNDGNRAENEAIKDKFNEKLGVSKAQEQAMLAGSMIRWDSIAAKPKSYDENGKAIKPKDYER